MNLICTCDCPDTASFARDAFRILFPQKAAPAVVMQKPQNVEIAKWRPMLDALYASEEKFAYYFSDDEVWDLKKGLRVA